MKKRGIDFSPVDVNFLSGYNIRRETRPVAYTLNPDYAIQEDTDVVKENVCERNVDRMYTEIEQNADCVYKIGHSLNSNRDKDINSSPLKKNSEGVVGACEGNEEMEEMNNEAIEKTIKTPSSFSWQTPPSEDGRMPSAPTTPSCFYKLNLQINIPSNGFRL